MKHFLLPLLFFCWLCSCNQPRERTPAFEMQPTEKISFFPVTAFLKGQLYTVSQMGVNPLKTIIHGNQIDSSWLTAETFKTSVSEFLNPVIDSLGLVAFFHEEKFNDASLNTITLTYEPRVKLPDTLQLRRWDVYIDPETGKVKKIYMVKQKKDSTLQLTWVTDNWCDITTLIDKAGGNTVIGRQEKITWKF